MLSGRGTDDESNTLVVRSDRDDSLGEDNTASERYRLRAV